jgi:hypothetical protein
MARRARGAAGEAARSGARTAPRSAAAAAPSAPARRGGARRARMGHRQRRGSRQAAASCARGRGSAGRAPRPPAAGRRPPAMLAHAARPCAAPALPPPPFPASPQRPVQPDLGVRLHLQWPARRHGVHQRGGPPHGARVHGALQKVARVRRAHGPGGGGARGPGHAWRRPRGQLGSPAAADAALGCPPRPASRGRCGPGDLYTAPVVKFVPQVGWRVPQGRPPMSTPPAAAAATRPSAAAAAWA